MTNPVISSAARLLRLSGVVLLATLSINAQAAGDPAAGEEKAATCAACHGANGISEIPSNPILAGQYVSYLEQALKGYRSGARQNAIMSGFASQLTDQDIQDLAAWFSSQPGPLQTAPRK